MNPTITIFCNIFTIRHTYQYLIIKAKELLVSPSVFALFFAEITPHATAE
jgi:hypothetical protein